MRGRKQSGFTILEVMIGVGILAIAVLGLVASLSSTIVGSGTTTDTQLAMEGVRGQIEDMRAHPDFSTLLATYNNRTFNIAGLRPRSSGTPHGTITFLTEAQAKAYWAVAGAPQLVDLDWTGAFDPDTTDAPAADWGAYAVRVTVTWGDRTANTDRTIEMQTMLFNPAGT